MSNEEKKNFQFISEENQNHNTPAMYIIIYIFSLFWWKMDIYVKLKKKWATEKQTCSRSSNLLKQQTHKIKSPYLMRTWYVFRMANFYLELRMQLLFVLAVFEFFELNLFNWNNNCLSLRDMPADSTVGNINNNYILHKL